MNKKTIKHLIKIVLLVLVISYVSDKLIFFSLNKISDKVMTGQSVGKLNHFFSVKDSTEFIVFGNSRANHHIDIDLINTNGFNIGVDGTGIAYSSTLINTLPKDKEQLILVHVDTDNFFNRTYNGEDIRALKTKYLRNNNITASLNKSGQLSTLQKFFYSMNYNGTAIGIIKNYFKPNYDYRTYNGYDPLIVSKSQEAARNMILSKINLNKCLDSSKINPLALEYLKSIKTYTQESPKKTFLFITTPMLDDPCSGDNAKLAFIMQDLGLIYMDFTNLYKDSKDNSYWKDATHMSVIGAEKFTTHLLGKLKPFM